MYMYCYRGGEIRSLDSCLDGWWILPSCHEMLLLLLLLLLSLLMGCFGLGWGYSPFHPERGNGLDVFFLPSIK